MDYTTDASMMSQFSVNTSDMPTQSFITPEPSAWNLGYGNAAFGGVMTVDVATQNASVLGSIFSSQAQSYDDMDETTYVSSNVVTVQWAT